MTTTHVPIGGWFGEPWPQPDFRAPICQDDRLRVPVPVGERCSYCDEPVEADHAGSFVWDATTGVPIPIHKECSVRSVAGPVAYLEGRCTHAGGTEPCEPEGQTAREGALATEAWLNRRYGESGS